MFFYNLKLGLKSIRRNPIMSSLMVVAIALGIGACMTTVTVFYMMDSHPNPDKNDLLYAVQLDSWNPLESIDVDEAPSQVGYTNAMALMRDAKGLRQTAMTKTYQIIQPEDQNQTAFISGGRAAFNDFFEMFDTTFQYGNSWSDRDDSGSAKVVVLNKRLNDQVFAGKDSVGETLNIDNLQYTIVGVLTDFNPQPKYFDLTNNTFADTADFFIPFNTMITNEISNSGNTNCWGSSGATYAEFLSSNCVWIQYWVELEKAPLRGLFFAYQDGYG